MRSPYHAIPFEMLTQLKDLGFSNACVDLEVLNQSAMLRCAASSQVIDVLETRLHQIAEHREQVCTMEERVNSINFMTMVLESKSGKHIRIPRKRNPDTVTQHYD